MQKISKILSHYEGENAGIKSNLAKILSHGKLKNTGKMVILAVDQGFEHGPDRSFGMNELGYDPHYHYKFAIDAGLSGFAAPLGMLEAGADTFAGQLPTILKINSSNSLFSSSDAPMQAVTTNVKEALRIGATAVGFTTYPGSDNIFEMMEQLREVIAEARSLGLPTIVWCYPRGRSLSKEGETAIDIACYSAHMALLMGAHIVKVKVPTNFVFDDKNQKIYRDSKIQIESIEDRIKHLKKTAFNGRRLAIFSGGATKDDESLLKEIEGIKAGGGDGSIIGRNIFQRDRKSAMELVSKILSIYKK